MAHAEGEREFNHNRAPGQARDRAIADWPEGRGSGHGRVKETEDTETDEGVESGIEISRGGAGARREKIQKIVCLGFYSRGFASFAGKSGFAADLGRFGETTLPFYRWALQRIRLPVFFSAPLRLRVSLRPKIGSGVRMVARVTKFVSRLTRSVGGPSRTASDLCKNDSEVMEFVSGQTRGMSELTKCVSRLMKKLSGLTKIISRVTSEVSELTKKVSGLTEFVSRLTIRDI